MDTLSLSLPPSLFVFLSRALSLSLCFCSLSLSLILCLSLPQSQRNSVSVIPADVSFAYTCLSTQQRAAQEKRHNSTASASFKVRIELCSQPFSFPKLSGLQELQTATAARHQIGERETPSFAAGFLSICGRNSLPGHVWHCYGFVLVLTQLVNYQA